MKDLKKDTQFLTLKHYKEPLLKVEKRNGHGYYGAISITMDGEKMQCHVCGDLFSSVQAHAWQRHNLTADQYREKYKLAHETGLISEAERDRRKFKTLEWLGKQTEEDKAEFLQKAKERYQAYLRNKRGKRIQPKITLETKNKRGTCPDQLLAKIKECKKALGEVPSKIQFIEYCGSQRFVHLIYKTYGSWSNALKMLGMQPKQSKIEENQTKPRYTNEELLEYITIFFQENGKVPTYTDCKRGLLPSYDIYERRFGSFPKAREIAGLEPEDLHKIENSNVYRIRKSLTK
jgi:predicted transcriptional regulator